MHTQHDINSHMVASVTQILFGHISSNQSLLNIVSKLQVPTNEQLVIITFIKSVIPSVSGQEMSLINHFKWQVRTTGQLASYLLNFYHMPSGRSEQPDNWHLPFISQSFRVASPNNRIACVSLLLLSCFKPPVLTDRLKLYFIFSQAASPNRPFEFICYLVSSRQS